jgi:TetR/AcrR family transcriptional regulator, cholesterol catabolism regulator
VTSLIELQRAAVLTFSERGYAATGIRDIATAAGVTSGALYMHAPSKMALLESVMHLALDELLRIAETVRLASPDPATRLAGLVRAHVSVQARNPRTVRVVDGEVRILPAADRPVILEKRDAYEAYWADVLRDGIACRDFAVDEPAVSRLALLEMCNGVARWYRPGGPLSLERLQDVFVRLAFNLVGFAGAVPAADPSSYARVLPCEPAEANAPHISAAAPVGAPLGGE